MALIAGIAVMIIPRTMKSAKVVASKSGGGRYSSFDAHGGPAVDLDDVALLDRPVGIEGLALPPAHVQLDDGAVADRALPAGGDAGDAAGGDRSTSP